MWWDRIKEWTHEPSFNFNELRDRAFSLRTRVLRPVSWAMLEDYHDKNEAEVRR